MPQPVAAAGVGYYPPAMQMQMQPPPAGVAMGMGFGVPPPPGFFPFPQMQAPAQQVQAVAVMPASVHAQLRALEDKVETLMEFMEEAEERLSGMEIFGVELEDNLDELEKRAYFGEETVEGMEDGAGTVLPPVEALVKSEYDETIIGEEQHQEEEDEDEEEVEDGNGESGREATLEREETARYPKGEWKSLTKRRLSETESERPVSSSSSSQSKRMRMSNLTD